ncbi:MAG: response regulator [Pseudomonadota bacterium]
MSNEAVLLVEDDVFTLSMMTELLDELGLPHEFAKNGQDCLDLLDQKPYAFHTVLLDIHMPRKNGIETLHEIRANPKDPPRNVRVVAMTADTAWHDQARAEQEGFDAVLPKPIRINSIKNALGGRLGS